MFEKDAENYAFDEVKHKQEWYIKHPERSIDEDYEDIKKHWGDGAEFGYSKGKAEARELLERLIANAPNTYSGTDIELQQKKMFSFQDAINKAEQFLNNEVEK